MMSAELVLSMARDRQRDLIAEAAATRLVARSRRTRRATNRAS